MVGPHVEPSHAVTDSSATSTGGQGALHLIPGFWHLNPDFVSLCH